MGKTFVAFLLVIAAGTRPLAADGYRIILMIDHSGSMKDTDPAESRIAAVTSLLGRAKILREDETDFDLSLIHIGNRYPDNDNPLDFDEIWKPELGDAIMAKVERSLKQELNARTDIYGAMKKAARKVQMARDEGRTPVIVLITDGEIDLDGHYGPGVALSEEEIKNRRLAISLAQELGVIGTLIYVLEVPGVRDSDFLTAVAAGSDQPEKGIQNHFRIKMSDIPEKTGRIANDLWGLIPVPVNRGKLLSQFRIGDMVESFLLDIILDVETQGDRDLRRDLHPLLVAPDGTPVNDGLRVNESFADQVGISSSQAFVQFTVILGGELSYGDWKFYAAEDLAYKLRPTVDSRAKLELFLEESTYFLGQAVTVYCDVTHDDRALPREMADDVKVSVMVSREDSEDDVIATLELYDSGQSRHQDAVPGDARYSNRLRLTDRALETGTYSLVARLELESAAGGSLLLSEPRVIHFDRLACDSPGAGVKLAEMVFDPAFGIKKKKGQKLSGWLKEGEYDHLRKKAKGMITPSARKMKKRLANLALRSLLAESWIREEAFDQGEKAFVGVLEASRQVGDDLTLGESNKLQELHDLIDQQIAHCRRQVECVKCAAIQAEMEKAEAGRKTCVELRDQLEEFSAYGCPADEYPVAAARLRECAAAAEAPETADLPTQEP